jgi:hypothetical protein
MLLQIGLGGIGISVLYHLAIYPQGVAELPYPPAVFFDPDQVEPRNAAHFHIANILGGQVAIRPGMHKTQVASQIVTVLTKGRYRPVLLPTGLDNKQILQSIKDRVARSSNVFVFAPYPATPEICEEICRLWPQTKIIEVTDNPEMLVIEGLHLHVAGVGGQAFLYNLFVGARKPTEQRDVNCPQASFVLASMLMGPIIQYLQGIEVQELSGLLIGVR